MKIRYMLGDALTALKLQGTLLSSMASGLSSLQKDVYSLADKAAETYAQMYRELGALKMAIQQTPNVFDLTDEQLNKVLALREPLSIPEHAADIVREIAKYGGYYYRETLGGGHPYPLVVDWRLQPDGSIELDLLDANGARFWRGTFREPGK